MQTTVITYHTLVTLVYSLMNVLTMDRLQGPVVLPCTQAATFSMMAGLPDTQPMRYLVVWKV